MNTTTQTPVKINLLWTGSFGCTTYAAGGHHGSLTGFHYEQGGRKVGAFVSISWTDEPEVWYVPLGRQVGDHHHEVLEGARRITRDEFDRINDLHSLRADMGWK